MADYELFLSDPAGNRLALIPTDRVASLSYSLVTNAVGSLSLELPRDAIPDSSIMADGRIEVRRRPSGGNWRLEGQTFWLIQRMTRGVGSNGRYRRIVAESANALLKRRFTMYFAGSSQVAITSAQAANALQSIATTNIGASANGAATYAGGVTPSRRLDAYLTVEAPAQTTPTIAKEFAWRTVLSVMQDVANDAATAGTPVYFGIVWTGDLLAFRTWVGQPGINRTVTPGQLTISPERGSLGGTVEVTEDWSDVATWVVAGGQGQNAARTLGQAYDTGRIGRSPFGVRELFVNATSMSTTGSLAAEASSELFRRRPKKVLTGQIVSVPGALYGLDWGHGDRLTAQFEHDSFSALVETVTVKLERGDETIDAKITGEAA